MCNIQKSAQIPAVQHDEFSQNDHSDVVSTQIDPWKMAQKDCVISCLCFQPSASVKCFRKYFMTF